MVKNNNFIDPEDIKAWEDFKNQRFLDGDKGEVLKNSKKDNKTENHIDFKIDLHGFSLEEAFNKIRQVIRAVMKKI